MSAEDDQPNSDAELRAAFRIVLEEVQEEIIRLSDPANVRLPQFEDKGYSWSLIL